MAAGVLLDRLASDWKRRILEPSRSLTDLVREAVRVSPAHWERALEGARREMADPALVEAKTRLAREGKARIDSMVARIEQGEGTALKVDYSRLESPRVGMAFTPFGITVVDEDRTIYPQVIGVSFADGAEITQTVSTPLLHDKKRKWMRFRLPRVVSREEVDRAVGRGRAAGGEPMKLDCGLPGVKLRADRAQIRWEGQDLSIVRLSAGR